MSGRNARDGILVTGATGNVGSEVCRNLAGADRPVFGTVVARDREADGGLTPAAAERLHGAAPRAFDFTDPATWAPALEGVSRVFLMRPPHIANIERDMRPFIDYLAERAVDHVVFLSVQGAEKNSIVPHHEVEQALLELGIPHTFIRPSFFMQNLTTTHLPEIRDERRIYVPAGDGETNFVDVRDVAAAIAVALVDDAHRNTAYTITGEESFTYHEVAEHLTRLLGVTITYEPARLVPFLRYQRRQGRSLRHALVMYALYSVTRLGRSGGATDAFERITGRKPRSLDEFIRDHRDTLIGSVGRPSARGASG